MVFSLIKSAVSPTESTTEETVQKKVRKEVIIHFTPIAIYLYKGFYYRNFEGSVMSPTSVIFIEDKEENQYFINGSYVIVPYENEEEIEKIISRYQIRESSLDFHEIDLRNF